MNIFQIQLLYYVGVTATAAASGAYCGIILVHAYRKHLGFVWIWLSPFFVGNLIGISALLIQDYHFFTGTRATMPDYMLTLFLPVLGGSFGIYGFSRLSKIVAGTPSMESAAFAGVEPDPTQEGPWPPPNKPAN